MNRPLKRIEKLPYVLCPFLTETLALEAQLHLMKYSSTQLGLQIKIKPKDVQAIRYCILHQFQ